MVLAWGNSVFFHRWVVDICVIVEWSWVCNMTFFGMLLGVVCSM